MSRVYVGRLSNHTRERDLEEAFGKYGRIVRTDLKYGYAFVEFEDSRDADDAVKEMDGRNLDGERIIVEHAKGPARGSDRRDRDRDRDRDDRDRDRDRAPRQSEGRCFNCGGGGHWARDCPDEGGRDRCFNCGRNGHLARECREGKRSSRGRYHPYRRSRSRSRSRSPRKSRKSASKSPRRSSSPKKTSRSPSHSPSRDKEDKDNKDKENDHKSP